MPLCYGASFNQGLRTIITQEGAAELRLAVIG